MNRRATDNGITGRLAYWLRRNSPNIVGACTAGVIGAFAFWVFAMTMGFFR